MKAVWFAVQKNIRVYYWSKSTLQYIIIKLSILLC